MGSAGFGVTLNVSLNDILKLNRAVTHEELARALNISTATLRSDIRPHRDWLYRHTGYVPGAQRIRPRQLLEIIELLGYGD